MGIYDRDYYRDWRSASGLDSLTPVVKYLIFANIAVFVLQILWVREVKWTPEEYFRRQPGISDWLQQQADDDMDDWLRQNPGLNADDDPVGPPESTSKMRERQKRIMEREIARMPPQRISIIQEWFELDSQKVVHQGQVWRLLTHAFCHDRFGIFHILFNMLALYWFGCTLETMYGSREFLLFYLMGAIVAALALVGFDLYTGSSTPAIGASGAVMAVLMLYTMHFPYSTIRVFWFFPLEMRWLMILYIIWDVHPVLLSLAGDQQFTGVAHAAHLGGAAFGFLYAHFHWRLSPWTEYLPKLQSARRSGPARAILRFPHAPVEPDAEAGRLDELLQKILDSGQGSLTPEETQFLREASERRKRRREES